MNRYRESRIGVLMGGRSKEREISLKTGNAIYNALKRRGYDVEMIDCDEQLPFVLKDRKIGVCFIALHGRYGEDGTVQGLLEVLRIPYTGSGVIGSAICMDKVFTKRLLESLGIPTPKYVVLEGDEIPNFPTPCVVKPAREGSTIGVSIVKERSLIKEAVLKALEYDRKVIIEEYVEGEEITVGIVNGKILPIVKIVPKTGFYDYEAKYTRGMTEYEVPAKITEETEDMARSFSKKIYDSFELSGCVRIDMMVKDNIPYVLDINTSPGMTETSLVPKAWQVSYGTFDDLVEEILLGASLKL